MPGWFEEHWDNMRRYKHMTCLGAVVGTESNGSVKARGCSAACSSTTPRPIATSCA